MHQVLGAVGVEIADVDGAAALNHVDDGTHGARLGDDDLAQGVVTGLQRIGHAPQHRTAFLRFHVRPGALIEGFARRRNGRARVFQR